ncbi:MAG: hypothetical protein V1918_01290, partial [Planctomycetota bacterium]
IIAFAMARMWTYLALIAGGLGVFYLTRALMPPETPYATAIFAGIGSATLLGGLIVSLLIARKGKEVEEEEEREYPSSQF